MKKTLLITLFCMFAVSLPLQASAQSLRERPVDTDGRIDSRVQMLIQNLCERITGAVDRGLPIPIPSFCTPVPPATDMCPNVPGDQVNGPCADTECVADGGEWDGDSCEMPPAPPVDVCENVPGVQESGPCADDECVADGGEWNGESCDMPPPPEGNLVINEIMYDLPTGSDTGREWVELRNGTNSSIDLSGWKFSESGGDHTLTLNSGGLTLPSGGFAVIADNPIAFLADWPGFSGTLLDSTAFTLSNTGETVAIKNSLLEIIDQFTYSTTTGATGDGNSLQRTGDGNWIAALPTPGAENAPDASEN